MLPFTSPRHGVQPIRQIKPAYHSLGENGLSRSSGTSSLSSAWHNPLFDFLISVKFYIGKKILRVRPFAVPGGRPASLLPHAPYGPAAHITGRRSVRLCRAPCVLAELAPVQS